jgi:hypothetical protein
MVVLETSANSSVRHTSRTNIYISYIHSQRERERERERERDVCWVRVSDKDVT